MSFPIDHEEYPILKQITYLDTPFEGLVPRSAWKVLADHAKMQTDDFLSHDAEWRYALRDELRTELAETVNLSQNEVALVPGFSVGLRELVPWLTRFKKVILIEDDYPTLLDAFSVGGFEITFVARDEDGSFSFEDLAYAMEQNEGGLFAFAHVHNVSGLRLDTERISGLARANGITTLMDVTQSFGCMPLDLSSMDIDVIVCSPYKWSGSGFGIGFVTVKRTCESLAGAIDQLNTGHLDPYSMLRFQQALRRLKALGVEQIWDHIDGLNDRLCQALESIGIKVYSDRSRNSRSAIVQFEGSEALAAELLNKGIRTSFRGTGIRVGVHWYNTTEDVDRLIAALSR
jgi:selenocysteine lyase/cysteine desulfurase